MKTCSITPILLLLCITLGCKDECRTAKDEIFAAKSKYESSLSNSDCLAFENLLTNFINGSCEHNEIDYKAIFQSYLDVLDCINLPTCNDGIQNGDETGIDCGGSLCNPCNTSTCGNGVQDGDETGVDCGGSCPPCGSSHWFVRCNIDGTLWETQSTGLNTGRYYDHPNSSTHGAINGDKSENGQVSSLNIFNELNNLTLQGYTFVSNGSFGSDFPSNSNEVTFGYSTNVGGVGNKDYVAVPNSGNMTLTQHNTTDGTLSGSFSLRAHDNNGDTLNILNGEFFVEIQ